MFSGMSRRLRGVAGVVLGVSAGLGLFGCGASGPSAREKTLAHRPTRFLLEVSSVRSPNSKLEVVTSNGRVIRRIATVEFDAPVAVSPNGKLLAWRGHNGLVVARIDGSTRRIVNSGYGFVWSPDSKAILTTDSSGALDIVSVATGAKRQIVKPLRGIGLAPLAWPRSHTIVFQKSGTSSASVVLADQNGTSQHSISSAAIYDSGGVGATVSVSPNRQWINVITTFEATGDPITSEFESVNLLTGERTRARGFDMYYEEGAPVWSPDSSRIVAGVPSGPLRILSPSGQVRALIRRDSVVPVAWTPSAIYLLPGNGGQSLLAIPTGHTTAKIAFKLPRGQEILAAQPF
jgi:hypothetical protein